jgi:sugar/nucleoside kinase (ribokinase family)
MAAEMEHEDFLDLEDRAAAFVAGYDTGYAAGRNDRRAEAEAVRLATAAAEVVLRCAGLPEVDPAESARRRSARDRRWGA